MLPEKQQSPLRALFRTYARRNNYPEALSEAMVSTEIEVWELKLKDGTKQYVRTEDLNEIVEPLGWELTRKDDVLKFVRKEGVNDGLAGRRVVVREGELLTMHTQEAVEFGFCRKIVKDIDGVLAYYKLTGATVRREELTDTEEFVRWFDGIAPVLIGIGMLGIIIELKTPGFGLPGIIGIAVLVVVFSTKYLVGVAEYWEILVFVLGVMLLFVELFITPGFGILGASGLLLMFIGTILSFQDFAIPETDWQRKDLIHNIATLGSAGIMALIGTFVAGRFLPMVPVFNRLILRRENVAVLTSSEAPAPGDEGTLLGKIGLCTTTLRPSGKMRLGGKTYSAMTEGDFISKGEQVLVLRLEGNRIVVRKAGEQESE